MPRPTNGRRCVTALLGLILAAPFGSGFPVATGDTRTQAGDALDTIVVEGRRFPESIPDEELGRLVKTTLHDDPVIYDEHITVTVTNGIVHLEGMVLEAGDIKDVLRLIRKKFPDLKRVINELEICRQESDAG